MPNNTITTMNKNSTKTQTSQHTRLPNRDPLLPLHLLLLSRSAWFIWLLYFCTCHTTLAAKKKKLQRFVFSSQIYTVSHLDTAFFFFTTAVVIKFILCSSLTLTSISLTLNVLCVQVVFVSSCLRVGKL